MDCKHKWFNQQKTDIAGFNVTVRQLLLVLSCYKCGATAEIIVPKQAMANLIADHCLTNDNCLENGKVPFGEEQITVRIREME